MKARGDRLELRVVRLFERLGYRPVRRGVRVKDAKGNWSEIDVVAGGWFPRYIECKNYSDAVGLEHVAKFKEVLAQNGVPLRRGLFITTASYTPRAKETGLTVWAAADLLFWERVSHWVAWGRWSVRWALRALVASALFAGAWTWADRSSPLWHDTVRTSPPLLQVHLLLQRLQIESRVAEILRAWRERGASGLARDSHDALVRTAQSARDASTRLLERLRRERAP
jgi:hypothetical protein